MNTLFPKRQAAVKVLYEAAGRLLHDAGGMDGISRSLNKHEVDRCVELAEEIGKLGPITITADQPVSLEVKGVPFDLGFIVETKTPNDPDFEVLDADDKS